MRHTAAVNNTHQDTPTAGTDDASEWAKICVLGVHFGFNCFPKCVNMVPSKRTCLDQHTAVSTDALLYSLPSFPTPQAFIALAECHVTNSCTSGNTPQTRPGRPSTVLLSQCRADTQHAQQSDIEDSGASIGLGSTTAAG
jgi:hypothetical protein